MKTYSKNTYRQLAGDLMVALNDMISDYKSEGCADPNCLVCAKSKKALNKGKKILAKADRIINDM